MANGKKTEFDKRLSELQAARKAFGDEGFASEAIQVDEILRLAGVAQHKIDEIRANPSMVALIQANPDLVTRLAQQFPASYAISYFEQRTKSGLGLLGEPIDPHVSPEIVAARRGAAGPPISPTGAVEYEGGVFVQDGTVYFPPNDPGLMGSPAWMAQIPRWSDERAQNWAKTLKQMGYLESTKVDLVTLTDALNDYHTNRYLYGGGKPVDLTVGAQGVSRADFGGILDPAVLDTKVRDYHQLIFGANDEPSAEELKRGREFLAETALQLARNKDLAPFDAADVAGARAQRRFLNEPATRKWQELEETDMSLHDSFVNLFQVLSR